MASGWNRGDIQYINLEIDGVRKSIAGFENQLRENGENDDQLQDELQYYRNKLSYLEDILADKQSIPSLKQCAEAAALKSLGDVFKDQSNPFCCGGELEAKILVHYKMKSGELREITFPGADEEALSHLLSAGSVASFGKGTEQVTDLSYRDAFKLDPDVITTSFHPGSTSILSEIETFLVPNRSIRAELHKLNMYTGPGGHFRSHVDTPRSEDMFGSLVVCLPTKFTGGTLVTRHGGKQTVFDWSPSADPPSVLSWAAFFSDVEHEIFPVTSGHRLTLTYNLYFVKEFVPNSTAHTSNFYTDLKKALYTPHFMRDGGCLAFDCQHVYAFNLLNEKKLLPYLLKGNDYAIYCAAKSLGLLVAIKPVMEGYEHWYILPQFPNKIGVFQSEGEGDYGRFRQSSEDSTEPEQSMEWEVLDNVYKNLPREIDSGDIIIKQCTQPSCRQLVGVYTHYGNEAADIRMCYHSATILIELPPWGQCPRTLASDIGPEPPRKKKKMSEAVVADDNNIYSWSKDVKWKKVLYRL